MATTSATEHQVTGRFLALLAVPSFGLSLSITTVTTYLPVLLSKVSGPTATGVLIGFEGLLALVIPGLVGGWSDRTDTRFGRRLPFVLAGAPLMAIALMVMPFTTAIVPLAIALFVFYGGYFTFYAPYRAMYPDLVPEPDRPRSQGAQNTAREIGLGVALVGGGFLLGIWKGLPFAVSAAVLLAVTAHSPGVCASTPPPARRTMPSRSRRRARGAPGACCARTPTSAACSPPTPCGSWPSAR